jgi:hypothetical protein
MAELVYGDQLKNIEQPFITLSEPTCGAGVVLGFVKVMLLMVITLLINFGCSVLILTDLLL